MTLDEQLRTIGYVGAVMLTAFAILVMLWLGARQHREERAATLWRVFRVHGWLELLIALFKR